jgi:pimeloyl-ACP methyl ester carboxylesterase
MCAARHPQSASPRSRRWTRGLLVGGALGLPVLAFAASAWIRHRAPAPRPPQWGRRHRYAGRFGEIVYQQLGQQPGQDRGARALVLLHSFGPGHDAGEWRGAAEILGQRFRVYVPDLPGWARSEAPRSYRPASYLRVLEDFLGTVVGEPAVVVAAGHSAAYAAELAAVRPELFRGLALVAPVGLRTASDEPRPSARLLRRLLLLPIVGAALLDALTSRNALIRYLRRDVYAAPERVDAALVDQAYRASHHPKARRALAAYLAGQLDLELTTRRRPARLPVWLAWGRQAVQPPVENADLWLRHFPQAELDVFEGCGLLPHAEAAARFCHALVGFVDHVS